MIRIRKEKTADFAPIYLAFKGESEAKLVENLRKTQSYISLAADVEGKIVGHIFFSPITVEGEETNFLELAPVAVLPEFPNQGIGSELVIEEGSKLCGEKGFTAVFVSVIPLITRHSDSKRRKQKVLNASMMFLMNFLWFWNLKRTHSKKGMD